MNNDSNKQTIIITGSNGFIGSAVIKRLSQKFNVLGFDKEIPEKSMATKNYAVDISSTESVSKALSEVNAEYGPRIASVIHLAAYYSFAEEESPQYEKITVKGTEQFIQLLKKFEVEQFIFSSTMLVHKPAEIGEKITESSPLNPSWAYPKSKIEAEKILKSQHLPIPLVNLRIAGVYDDLCHSIPISNQIMRIYEKHLASRLYPGNASKGQAFLHIDDLVEAICKIIEKRKTLPNEVDFLIGEPKALSYDELQSQIGLLIYSKEWLPIKIPSLLAKLGSWIQHHTPLIRKPFIMPWMIDFTNDHYELDISLAQNLLEWQPRHELQKTLPVMIEDLKKNPLEWYKKNKLEEPSELARVFGRMPGDYKGFEVPSKSYIDQLNFLNLMNILWGLWIIFDIITRQASPEIMISSVLSGSLVMIFSAFAYFFLWQWPRWFSAIVGIWILFSPLAFWTNSSSDYSMANLLGFLVVICGSLQPDKYPLSKVNVLDKPRGWDYNPSSWPQRIPIIILAFAGFFIARYMAAFQLGHINSVWDPVFGEQTHTILKSDISKAFPVSDAGLGAFSYLLDAISGLIGDKRRWKTMPWMVILFGIMIIPPGVTSIALVILQPVAVNAWCFLCLLTAFIMLLMVSPALDEVVATVQFLRQAHREGRPFWRTFFNGESMDHEAPLQNEAVDLLPKKIRVGIPYSLVVTIIMSAGLMYLPAFFSVLKPSSNLIYFSSALMFTFAVISTAEIARPIRFLNTVLGLILAVGIWFLDGISFEAKIIVDLISISISFLSLPKGKFRHHFGSYDKLARWQPLKSHL